MSSWKHLGFGSFESNYRSIIARQRVDCQLDDLTPSVYLDQNRRGVGRAIVAVAPDRASGRADGTPLCRPVAADQRLNLLNLVRWLEELNVTTMMAAEARRDKAGTVSGHPLFLGTEERYLASGIIQLDYHRYGNGELVRYLQVLKMRGAAHDMRAHAYDLSIDGLAWLEPMFGKIKGE